MPNKTNIRFPIVFWIQDKVSIRELINKIWYKVDEETYTNKNNIYILYR